MGVFQVSQEDIDSLRLIKPGWHPFVITDVVDKPKEDDGSINTIVSLKGADEAADNVEMQGYFNEKPTAQKFAVPFLKAVNGGSIEPGTPLEISTKLVGRTVDCLISNVPYQGKMGNKIIDYRAHRDE